MLAAVPRVAAAVTSKTPLIGTDESQERGSGVRRGLGFRMSLAVCRSRAAKYAAISSSSGVYCYGVRIVCRKAAILFRRSITVIS